MQARNLMIWKYEIPFPKGTTLEIPLAGDVKTLQAQDGRPYIWVQVDPKNHKYKRQFTWVGTGHPYPEHWHYVGTLQQGPFVWHLFHHAPEGK